ncbi:MAG: GNAT family N-acetyltransferase [Beutenbergiaceae bacterium]
MTDSTFAAGQGVPAMAGELGLSWRGLASADIAQLHQLWHRIEEHDNPPYRTTVAEAQDRYISDWRGDATNVLGGFTNDGVLVTFGAVSSPPGEAATTRVYLEGGVDPQYRRRGVGSAVLDWQIGRARELVGDLPDRRPARIVVHVEDDMPDPVHMLRQRGFVPRRFYTELRRDLNRSLPDVRLPRPFDLVAWNPELDEQVRLAHNATFAEHWMSQPQTPETWSQGRAFFVPEWSFLVLDRTTDRALVVGYLLSAKYEQDWPSLGWSEGYIDLLGVRPDWRGRGIATALVSRAMRAFAAAGMEYASLGVDTDTPGEVFGLYSKLRFEPTRGSTMYMVEV